MDLKEFRSLLDSWPDGQEAELSSSPRRQRLVLYVTFNRSRASPRHVGCQRFQHHGHHLVVTNDDRQFDQLLLVVSINQLGPRSVAEIEVVVKFIRGPQEQGVLGAPPRGIRTFPDTVNLLLGERDLPTDNDMLPPLVLAAAVPRRAQYERLTIFRADSAPLSSASSNGVQR